MYAKLLTNILQLQHSYRFVMEKNPSDDYGKNFKVLVSSALPFLEGNVEISDKFIEMCKTIYDITKLSNSCSRLEHDPLPKLIIENFDNEQVWQEIDMFNNVEILHLLKTMNRLATKNNDEDIQRDERGNEDVVESNDESEEEDLDIRQVDEEREDSEEETGFVFEETDEDFVDVEQYPELYKRTEVDDEFFSLRKMESVLDDQEREVEGVSKDTDDEIDYFEDVPSDEDGSRKSRHLEYVDYFEPPSKTSQEDPSKVKKSVHFQEDYNVDRTDAAKAKLSSYEKSRDKIDKKIEIIHKNMLDKTWQMQGEVKAGQRPENSLLEENLTFDQVTRPAPEITEEHTVDLETLIQQRILDRAWDDVERKVKPDSDIGEFKKRIALDSNKSKMTLSEIYEQDYLQKFDTGEKEEEETEQHAEIKNQMKDLFRKLDALSNFHFTASLPEPKIKVLSNLASITVEDVQPVTHSESQTLAPEEIFKKSRAGEEKSKEERTTTDRKRERRKKKIAAGARSKAREKKLAKLDPNSDAAKKAKAVNFLKNAMKTPGSNTTLVKSPGEKVKTSQQFFSKLQDNVSLKTKNR